MSVESLNDGSLSFSKGSIRMHSRLPATALVTVGLVAVGRFSLSCRSAAIVSLIIWSSIELLHAQPVNDDFRSRTPITGEQVTQRATNLGATIERGEPPEIRDKASGSVWWKWTAPATATYLISTAGSAFDTLLGVFAGDALENLTLVASNDDEDVFRGIFTSRVLFSGFAGVSYSIAVAGIRDGPDSFAAGAIRLEIQPTAATPAPAWEAVDLEGKLVKSADFSGRILLIDFWATWCAPCRAEIPIFIELQNRFREDGLTIVGVSVDTAGPETVRAFMKELGMNYPVAMTNQKLEQDFGGISSIPTAFVVDRKGNLVLRHSGFGDREFWERAISSLFVQSGSGVQLRIERKQDGIVLSWPDAVPGFVLEESASLSVPTWRTLTSSVDPQLGFWAVTLPANQSQQFFRLIRQ